MKSHLKTLGLLYCILTTIFTVCIALAFCIPNESIRENTKSSVEQVMTEGMWFKPLNCYLFQVDNMTDCLMLNIAASADPRHPFDSAMRDEYGVKMNEDGTYCDRVVESTLIVAEHGLKVSQDTQQPADNCVDVRKNYGRYWHGYQVIIRPMLTIMDYQGIRILNYVLLTALIVAVASLLYVRVSRFYGISFLASLALINFPIVPLAMQFSTCFYIALVGMLTVLSKPSWTKDFVKVNGFFFVIGACTSYFDFLTTPQLTLGLPLIAMLSLAEPNTDRLKRAIAHSISWALGYALLWMSKWLVYRVITGESIMSNVATNAKLRTMGPIFHSGEELSIGEITQNILSQTVELVGLPIVVVAIIAIAMGLTWAIYRLRHPLREDLWLVVIIGIVPVWFAIMLNHSIQHIFFTWRAWLLPLWAMMILTHNITQKESKQ